MPLRLVPEAEPGMLFLRLVGRSNEAASALGRIFGVLFAPRPQHQVSQ